MSRPSSSASAPNFIDHITQVFHRTRDATASINGVRSGGQRDGGEFRAVDPGCRLVHASRRPWHRNVKCLVTGWVHPVVFGDPLINVTVVILVDIPRRAGCSFHPIEYFSAIGVERIGITCEVVLRTPARSHGEPTHQVVLGLKARRGRGRLRQATDEGAERKQQNPTFHLNSPHITVSGANGAET
jgi:hypothetical protein